ncbi:MAG TPA: hypothetical protein PLB26_16395 [Rubrivivax sp.]|nr:hypothetical protein [Rubrivivax sp.]
MILPILTRGPVGPCSRIVRSPSLPSAGAPIRASNWHSQVASMVTARSAASIGMRTLEKNTSPPSFINRVSAPSTQRSGSIGVTFQRPWAPAWP